MGKIVVGMSGGVDSSVAAFLLKERGFDVLGVFMKNWEDGSGDVNYRKDIITGCTWEEDYADVRAICDQLEIPYTTFNFVKEYRDHVFTAFLDELRAGRTPNPDIICNQEIKFKLFLEKALAMDDVDGIATGHYVKITNGKLCRPKDRNKDQTYFLSRIDPVAIPKIHFPLQDLTKDEVRKIAIEQNFPNANKKDSTGICFIGDIDYKKFISEHIDKKPGKIVDIEGTEIGEHDGLHLFTIGQRHGINIGGTGPYYVVSKDMSNNNLIVTNDKNDERLSTKEFTVENIHWLDKPELPLDCNVQIRYRQIAQPAVINAASDNQIEVIFQQPQRAVTPGQSAVFYKDDCVLGGGIMT